MDFEKLAQTSMEDVERIAREDLECNDPLAIGFMDAIEEWIKKKAAESKEAGARATLDALDWAEKCLATVIAAHVKWNVDESPQMFYLFSMQFQVYMREAAIRYINIVKARGEE